MFVYQCKYLFILPLCKDGLMKSYKKKIKRMIPRYYDYSEHKINPSQIDKRSVEVITQLKRAGYDAYIVGGALRDILLGRSPKDFDVVTGASPEQIKKVFPRAISIGRRFRLIHLHIEGHIIEVSTFRSNKVSFRAYIKALFSLYSDKYYRENIYGTISEDVERRDITMNALYYDPTTRKLIDYTGGFEDAKKGILNVVGNPKRKFLEDPMRIMRILRFSAKLNLDVGEAKAEIIHSTKDKVYTLPGPRLFDEFTKFFCSGHALASYKILMKYKAMPLLFSYDWDNLSAKDNKVMEAVLKDTDKRFSDKQNLAVVFLLSLFLWPAYRDKISRRIKPDSRIQKFNSSHRKVCDEIIQEQKQAMAIPIRFFWRLDKIWALQYHMQKAHNKKKPQGFVENKNFKFAYDLMKAISITEPKLKELCDFWKKYATQSGQYFAKRKERHAKGATSRRAYQRMRKGAKKGS